VLTELHPEAEGLLPAAPEPVTDGGGGDRLVVVTQPAVPARPSATLLAAQQLSAEADRYPHHVGRPGGSVRARRRVLVGRVIEQRRAERG
jgi:hypothetical protein